MRTTVEVTVGLLVVLLLCALAFRLELRARVSDSALHGFQRSPHASRRLSPWHCDSLYMTPKTPAHLVATWIALEDVHPDAGPLVYYPASHKIPLYTFSDGTHHARQEEMPNWSAYIESEMRRRGIEAKTFLAGKGDLFIWHSDLVHGGSAIGDPTRTRRSLVCHYFTESVQLLEPKVRRINRFSQGVHTPPERFGPDRPFPEEVYLRRYPDVREAVERGFIPSGFYHYQHHGFAEKRPL